MSESTATETASPETASASPEVDVIPADLGEAGAKALESLKSELREAKKELADRRAAAGDERGLQRLAQERKELEALREFKAKAEGTEAEYKASIEAQRLTEEALKSANVRIVKSELRAAAKGKLADPADAHLYIDISSIEVGENGEVDPDALNGLIDELLTKKPHLAADDGTRFKGAGDGGAGAPPKPNESIDEAIAAAQAARNYALVATLRTQKAAQTK